MHAESFIHDMAIIMLIAGVVTLIFNRLKQPVVLGYLVAGIIIGPHSPPINFVHDQTSVQTLGEMGVVFLMFSLGLEFSLKKIAKVGPRAFFTAICETSFMLVLGYNLGRFLGFNEIDSFFLGSMITISSTTIIVKALNELGLKQHKFSQLIFGILIVEDIIAICIIALLSGLTTTANLSGSEVLSTLGQLSLFVIVTMTLGLLLIPNLINYIATFKSHEMLLVSVLGLCFGLCLVVLALEYSIALGAFMMGAIIAESKVLHQIEKLIAPLRDMFCAIFFVTIGMMFDPSILQTHFTTVLIICLVLVAGKIIGCTSGAFLAGENASNALRVGMSLAQIGEFSFIIAGLGVTMKVTQAPLYPLAIAVSAITTLLTPYCIKAAVPLGNWGRRRIPQPLQRLADFYSSWIQDLHPKGDGAIITQIVLKIIAQVIVNWALVAAVFIAGTFVASSLERKVRGMIGILADADHHSLIFTSALLISLPFIVAMYRKLKALSMILAELIIKNRFTGRNTYWLRRIIFEALPLLSIGLIMATIFHLTAPILPHLQTLMWICVFNIIIAFLLRNQLIRFHSWLQIKLFTVMEDKPHQV